MEKLFKTMKQTIEKYNMLQQGEKVLVGVSGGPDSICLLHALHQIRHEYKIEIAAAHINHMLRGEAAEQDVHYVEEFCKRLTIPIFVKNIDIREMAQEKKISEEVAGREVRYGFFFEIAQKVGAARIAVAHNLNDQAETVLMRFIRGTGLEGLAGISPIRSDGVIRPLLEVPRGLIEEYCHQYDLKPRTDETNFQAVYTRNKLRLQLIPQIMEQLNPNFIRSAANTAEMLSADNEFLNLHIGELTEKEFIKKNNGIGMSLTFLLSQHIAIQRRIIRKAIEILKGDTANIEFKHIEQILVLAESRKTGKELDLPDNVTIRSIYQNIYFCRKVEKIEEKVTFDYSFEIGRKIRIKETNQCI